MSHAIHPRLTIFSSLVTVLAAAAFPASVYAQGSSLPARVRALNNQVLNWHAQIQDASPAQAAAVRAQAAPVIAQREAALRDLIAENASEALKLAFPQELASEMRQTFPASASRFEAFGVWQAPLEYFIIDDATMTVHKSLLRMTVAQEVLEVHFAGVEPAGLRSGVIVRVRGLRAGNRVAAAEGSVQGSSAAAGSCSTQGDQKSVVLLVRNPDVALPTSPTPASVWDIFFASSGRSVDQYWREVSYGRASASGNVFGWFTLDQSYTCDQYYQMRDAAIRAASGAVNFQNYNRIFLVFPRPSTGCGWAGLGTLGCSSINANGSTVTASVSWLLANYLTTRDQGVKLSTHEGGHNLTMHHASSRRFKKSDGTNEMLGPLGATGTISEYGDVFSTMGSWNLGHYAAPHKAQIGWLQGTEIATVETNGAFTLLPFETSRQVLKIRRGTGNNAWLWVEYRRPIGGYDPTLPSQVFTGALIHYVDSTTGTRTHLLDATQETDSFTDPALAGGRAWVDPYTNVSLSVVSADANAMTLNVNYGPVPCTSQAPSVTLSPGSASTSIGGSYTYTVTVTNNDTGPCPAKSYALTTSSPSGTGWLPSVFASPTLVNIAPGANGQTTLTVTSDLSVSPGTYLVDATATNAADANNKGTGTANISVKKSPGGGSGKSNGQKPGQGKG